ncbi:MAG: AI-2E family transporter [Bdellovibrionales bacterium]|nr:AI-2E family transporter [Bdellovibrionales bacterium]
MKESGQCSEIQSPLKLPRTKGNLVFFGSRFHFFNLILVLSGLAVAFLFRPFAKSAMLALIFALAYLGARDRFVKLNKSRKYLVVSSATVTVALLLSSIIEMMKVGFSSVASFLDPQGFTELNLKISELFLPTIRILRDSLSTYFMQFDSSRTIETKLIEAIEKFLTSSVSIAFAWLSEIPNSIFQVMFFTFLFLFLIQKKKAIKDVAGLFLTHKKNNILVFLIETAKFSGYRAVVLTSFTALIQAFVLTLGSIIVGMKAWPFVFLIGFIFSLISVVRILPVAIVCIIYAGAKLGLEKAFIVGIFALVASILDIVLRSLLTSRNSSTLNPVLVFFALIGSLFVFGLSGLFLGPFILIFSAAVFNHQRAPEI